MAWILVVELAPPLRGRAILVSLVTATLFALRIPALELVLVNPANSSPVVKAPVPGRDRHQTGSVNKMCLSNKIDHEKSK
jgi:hypothetical protein